MRERLKQDARAPRGWLFSPAVDLLFGCGLAYALVFAVQCVAGPELRRLVPLSFLPFAAVLVSTPHYGATLLRVYEDAQDRRAYVAFALWGTLALCALFYLGLGNAVAASLLVTLYLTWSPWHYTAQNFGVTLLLLKRHGAEPSEAARRLLYASFVISYALAFVSLHGQPTPPYAPDGITGYAIQIRTLGIPAGLRDAAVAAGSLAWLGCAAGAVALLARRSAARAVGPVLCLIGSQSLWFVLPVVARNWNALASVEPLGLAHAQYSFFWVALAHAAQYVWITASFAETSARETSLRSFYARALAAGSIAWTVPALLFAPGALGKLPYDAGLGMLVAAVVNLHHFMLDGVIWKLRDRRVADVLLRQPERARAAAPAPRRGLARAAVGAFGALTLGVSAFGAFELNLGVEGGFARGDVARLERAERNLRWVGRASPEVQLKIGLLRMQQDDLDAAARAFEQSLALHPTTGAWVATGYLAAKRGSPADALAAYSAALALDPDHVEALFHSAWALAKLERGAEALERLEHAARLEPENAKVRALAEALRASR